MARQARIEFPGAVHHVMARGNRGRELFDAARASERFMEILADVVARLGWQLYGYCLMPNHYHLLVETPQANLGDGMKRLNGIYTQWYNARTASYGHLLQGRYRAILVDRDSYLLELVRYIALNPVRAGIAERAEDWPWSSARSLLGKAPCPGFLSLAPVWSQFGANEAAAWPALAEFLEQGAAGAPEEQLVPGIYGGRAFIASLARRGAWSDPPAPVRRLLRPSLDELRVRYLDEYAFLNTAYREHGYRVAELAAFTERSERAVYRLLTI